MLNCCQFVKILCVGWIRSFPFSTEIRLCQRLVIRLPVFKVSKIFDLTSFCLQPKFMPVVISTRRKLIKFLIDRRNQMQAVVVKTHLAAAQNPHHMIDLRCFHVHDPFIHQSSILSYHPAANTLGGPRMQLRPGNRCRSRSQSRCFHAKYATDCSPDSIWWACARTP